MAVRRATIDDAAAIGEVHVAAWRAAYRGLMPDAFLDGLSVEERAETWRQGFRRAAEEPPDRSVVLVSVDGGEVVGFAALGPAREQPGTTGAAIEDIVAFGEVVAFYLAPSHWGRGLGRELMEASLGELRGWGFTHALLWVLDANRRARRFYESGGWRADGASTVVANWLPFPIREVRYLRSL